MISIGTDCSGIEAPIQALKNLKIPFKHAFSSEIDEDCIKSIKANYHPEIIYNDMAKRKSKDLPDIDIYVCGFPCQPFSTAGKKLGSRDGRSNIMDVCIDVIKTKLPKVFILENVRGFMTLEEGKNYKYLMNELGKIKRYNIHPELLNTRNYGLPQNRERLYIVGVRKDEQVKEYTTPKHRKMKSLESILIDHRIHSFIPCKTTLKNINNIKNYNPSKNYVVSHAGFGNAMEELSPTLKCQSFFYMTFYKRKLYPVEALMLQGFPKSFKKVVSDTEIYKQAGNAMSVCVLEAIFKEVFSITKIK
jgi:DNA (cytosine-5)-methyltransferase 1